MSDDISRPTAAAGKKKKKRERIKCARCRRSLGRGSFSGSQLQRADKMQRASCKQCEEKARKRK
jgi:hypothetical protein